MMEVEGSGMSHAALLLQTYVGICIALAVVRKAANTYNWRYESVPLQKLYQSASISTSSFIHFAGFGIIQALGGESGFFTWFGLSMVTVAGLSTTVAVQVIPLFTGEIIGVDQKKGRISEDSKPFSNCRVAMWWMIFKKAELLMRLFGMLMLVFAGTPSGVGLLCGSMLLRLYFFGDVCLMGLETWTNFHGMRQGNLEKAFMICQSAALDLLPLLIPLVIVDHAVWGPMSLLMCLTHPAVYFTVAAFGQFFVPMGVLLLYSGSVKKGRVEFDVEFQVESKALGMKLCIFRYGAVLAFYAGLVLANVRVVMGTLAFSFSLEGLNVSWGSPLVAMAAGLLAIMSVAYVLGYVMATIDEFTGHCFPLYRNASENSLGALEHVPALALTMVVIQSGLPDPSTGFFAWLMWAAFFPSTHGILLAGAMVVFSYTYGWLIAVSLGTCAPCDQDGLAQYMPTDPFWLNIIYKYVVKAYFALLYGGMTCGWFGLGMVVWGSVAIVLLFVFRAKALVAAKQAMEYGLPKLAEARTAAEKFYYEKRGLPYPPPAAAPAASEKKSSSKGKQS